MKNLALSALALVLSLTVCSSSSAFSLPAIPSFLQVDTCVSTDLSGSESWASCLAYIQFNATSYHAETLLRLQAEVTGGQKTWTLTLDNQHSVLASGPELGWLDGEPIKFDDPEKAIVAATKLYSATFD